jgi:hypothetical protein
LNVYAYVRDNPIKLHDLNGTEGRAVDESCTDHGRKVVATAPPAASQASLPTPPGAAQASPTAPQPAAAPAPNPPEKADDDDRPDPVPIYTNIANASRTQAKDTTGTEAEIVGTHDSQGNNILQLRAAQFYGLTNNFTVGGDVLGTFTGDDSRGASFGATLRIGSDKQAKDLRWYQGFGAIITPRLNLSVGGSSLSANITGSYSLVPAKDWQIDANIYANPAADKTSVGGIVQVGRANLWDNFTAAAEIGTNRDLGAPDSKFRLQGGLGLTDDTSKSTKEKSQLSIYLEVVGDQNRPSYFLTIGGAFGGKGLF